MRVLVTGATGFVGRNFVRRALAAGHWVRCMVRDQDRALRILGKHVEMVLGDVTKPSTLVAAAEGMEAAVNLVGIVKEREGTTFQKIYVEGARHLLEALKRSKVRRYLHMSALGAQEQTSNRFYRAHWMGEELVRQSGLDYTIFKPSLIYGPNDRFTSIYVRIILWSPILPVLGSGKSKMQPISLDDVSRACLESLRTEASIGKSYILAGPETVTPHEMIDTILGAVGRRRLTFFVPRLILWLGAVLMEQLLPNPLFTREHLTMFRQDVFADITDLRKDLKVDPLPFKKGVRDYLFMVRR